MIDRCQVTWFLIEQCIKLSSTYPDWSCSSLIMEQYFGVRSFLDSVEQRLSPVVTQLRGILFSVDEEEIGDGTGDKDKHEPLSSASAPDACVSPSNSSSALAASRMTQSYHSDMKTASSPVFSSSSSSGVSAMQQLRKFMSVIGSSPPESSASLPSVSPRPDVNSNASNMSINNYSSSDLKRGKPQLHTTNSMPQPVLRNNNSYGEVRNHKNNASHTPSSDSCRNSWPATTRLPHQQLQPSNGIKKILDARQVQVHSYCHSRVHKLNSAINNLIIGLLELYMEQFMSF